MTIDAGFDLSVQLGHIAKGIDKMNNSARRDREIARARLPFSARFVASGTCPTPTAPFALNFGGPDAGFYWVVRRITAGGLTWSTTAAGSTEFYVHGYAGAPGSLTSGGNSIAGVRALSDIVDQATAMPVSRFYSSEQLIVQPNESLSVVVLTGTAGQQYVAATLVTVVRLTTSLEAEIDI